VKTKENTIVIILLAFLAFGITGLVLLSNGFYGGGDSIAHYRISHYAFKYPHLFLDHWGKPVFTLLSAAFSWFGFNGARIYNILAGLVTAYITYCLVKLIIKRDAFLTIILVVFAPIYFVLFFSSLTEITFSLVLIAGVYYAFKERYIYSALIFSFLPLARTEGIIIVPIFLVAFLVLKQYKSLPFFLIGFLLFSLAGMGWYDDFFWLITRMPYTGARDLYGSGSLFHFIAAAPKIFGYPLIILSLAGVVGLVIALKKKPWSTGFNWKIFTYVLLPFLAYFSAHSFVWWKGLGGSLGLIRVMAGMVPLAAVLGMIGYDYIANFIKNKFLRQIGLPALVGIFFIITPFQYFSFPMHPDPTEKVLKEAADWLKSSAYKDNKLYYYDLYFLFKLDVDPYNQLRCIEKIPDKVNPGKGLPGGSIVQWDAHYGPNEGGLPLDHLLGNKQFTLLKKFEPDDPIKMGDYNYAVYIFIRNEL